MTRTRLLEGPARQTKAHTARTCTTTCNDEQPDGAEQRKTATGPLTVPSGLELLDVRSRAPSSSSATGDQEGVGRRGCASASDQGTPKTLRRAIGRTPLDPARTRPRDLVVLSVRRRAQTAVALVSPATPPRPVTDQPNPQRRCTRMTCFHAFRWRGEALSPGDIWPAPRKTEQHTPISAT